MRKHRNIRLCWSDDGDVIFMPFAFSSTYTDINGPIYALEYFSECST